MNRLALFVAAFCAVSAPALAETGVGLAQTLEGRRASLLEGAELDATYRPSEAEPLRLIDSVRFGRQDRPFPLDRGGALDDDSRPVLSLVLGFLIGFGLGHLVAGDRDGFLLFLLVDVAIVVVTIVLDSVIQGGPFGVLGVLALVASHIIQGIDSYAEAGGERLVQRTRETALVPLASSEENRLSPATVTRVFRYAF
ncbi:MAG TPA: hypothetical protein VEY30_10925 [Myxococcaceae bacterium]|nr:hypothetical protein [Myxococcaceae bacterium]